MEYTIREEDKKFMRTSTPIIAEVVRRGMELGYDLDTCRDHVVLYFAEHRLLARDERERQWKACMETMLGPVLDRGRRLNVDPRLFTIWLVHVLEKHVGPNPSCDEGKDKESPISGVNRGNGSALKARGGRGPVNGVNRRRG